MSYVIYNPETTRVPSFAWGRVAINRYSSVSVAKSAITRAFNKGKIECKEDYAIAESGEFHNNIEKHVTRKNLMGGDYEEAINTPNCCSPSSETYWSM